MDQPLQAARVQLLPDADHVALERLVKEVPHTWHQPGTRMSVGFAIVSFSVDGSSPKWRFVAFHQVEG
jgi:hypothetical protein